jgi:hypothetical protein
VVFLICDQRLCWNVGHLTQKFKIKWNQKLLKEMLYAGMNVTVFRTMKYDSTFVSFKVFLKERTVDFNVTAVSLEKQKTSVPSTAVLKAKKQTLKTKPQEEVQAPPVKKVRRVLPEHEGRYKITMPSGSTPRTQKILAKQGVCKYYPKTKSIVLSVSLDTHFTAVCYYSDSEKEDCV